MQISAVDYQRKWYVLAAVGSGLLLSTIDGSIVNIALPTLVHTFQSQFAVVEWVVLAYLLTVTTLMLTMGRLGDMVGKKSLYLTGFIIFTAGSALCGISPTVYSLIGFRVLQAVGASMMMALGTAIIVEAFPPSERGKALGISGAVVSVGIVVGPVVGGLILGNLSWHWIFYVNLPIGIVAILLALRFVPDLRPAGGQRFDYLGAMTLFIGLMALMLALTFGQQWGFADSRVLLLFAGWLVLFLAFRFVEWKSKQPMIDFVLFRNPLFTVNLISGFLMFVCSAGTTILLPFYLENVQGFTPQVVGLFLACVPVLMGVVAPLSGSLSDRVGPRPITLAGLLVLVIGFLFASTITAQTPPAGLVLRLVPIGVGMGLFNSPNNSSIMGLAPREKLGVASGMLAMTRTLGQSTGISVLGALWAARVAHYAGGQVGAGASYAPAASQVAGLQDTLLAVVGVLCVALLMVILGIILERRQNSFLMAKATAAGDCKRPAK